MEYRKIEHPFGPLYNTESKFLVLGSFPSVKSREEAFFYGHPRNRYWEMISRIFGEPLPISKEDKVALALKHHIGMWDVIFSCEIKGSADSSIRNVVVNDLSKILLEAPIQRIICNGKLAGKLYQRYLYPQTQIEAFVMPSTSPANAAMNLEKLMMEWKEAFRLDKEFPKDV